MKCERCNKNQATLIAIQISDGKPKEKYICEKCAKESTNKAFDIPLSFQDFFQGILDIMSMQIKYDSNEDGQEIKAVSCNICRMTYDEFKSTGRLGCENCYITFKQLDTVIKNIHASNTHMGKIPARGQEELVIKREKTVLKNKLSEAIKNEEYEEAARLRDKIRTIEKGE